MVRKLPWASMVAGLATSGALLLGQAQPPQPPERPSEDVQIEQRQDELDQARDQAEQTRDRARAEQDRARDQAEQEANRQRDRSQDATERARTQQDRAGRSSETRRESQFGQDPNRDPLGQSQRPGEQPGQFDRNRDIRGETGRQQRDRQQFGQQGQQRGPGGQQDLGLSFETTEQGQLTVADIQQGAPGAQIGLQQGDRIVSVDGRTFRSGDELNQFLITQRAQRVPIIIERDGARQTVFWTSQQFGPPPGGPLHGGHPGFAGTQGQMGARSALGLHLDPNAPNVVVRQVVPGGPAEEAGIRAGDEILSLNGREVRHFTEFTQASSQLPPEQPATLEIARQGGQMQEVQVQPEPWHMVFQGSPAQQQFGQSFGRPQFQQGWTQQQFSAAPQFGQQWPPQQQFGARGQMGFQQQGQFGMSQPYGVARPPLEGMQSGQVQQEIDELHREIDNLRQQVQTLQQQIDSGRAGPPRRQGATPPRPERPQPPEGAQPGI